MSNKNIAYPKNPSRNLKKKKMQNAKISLLFGLIKNCTTDARDLLGRMVMKHNSQWGCLCIVL